eukprot:405783_1
MILITAFLAELLGLIQNYNPFRGYCSMVIYINAMTIHENEEQDIMHHSEPPLLPNNGNNIKLKLTQTNASSLPSINNSLAGGHNINNGELYGYYGTNVNNINTFGLSYSHSSDKLNIYNTHTQLHKHHKISNNNNYNNKYNLNISVQLVILIYIIIHLNIHIYTTRSNGCKVIYIIKCK